MPSLRTLSYHTSQCWSPSMTVTRSGRSLRSGDRLRRTFPPRQNELSPSALSVPSSWDGSLCPTSSSVVSPRDCPSRSPDSPVTLGSPYPPPALPRHTSVHMDTYSSRTPVPWSCVDTRVSQTRGPPYPSLVPPHPTWYTRVFVYLLDFPCLTSDHLTPEVHVDVYTYPSSSPPPSYTVPSLVRGW